MNIQSSIWHNNFLAAFLEIDSFFIDVAGEKKVKSFILWIDWKQFNYDWLKEVIADPLIWFCLSRKTRQQYCDRPWTLVNKAKEKIRDYLANTGELWEFLLYCFLEADLEAPKIISKLELKTASNDYVKWADGVHLLKQENGYIILFCESKTYASITDWIRESINSIHDFKLWNKRKDWVIVETDPEKYGISFERWIISSNLEKETFTEDEKVFVNNLIYPSKDRKGVVNTWFAILILFECCVDDLQELSHADFEKSITDRIKLEVIKQKANIIDKIKSKWLQWNNFHFYFLPFTNLSKTREELTKFIQK